MVLLLSPAQSAKKLMGCEDFAGHSGNADEDTPVYWVLAGLQEVRVSTINQYKYPNEVFERHTRCIELG